MKNILAAIINFFRSLFGGKKTSDTNQPNPSKGDEPVVVNPTTDEHGDEEPLDDPIIEEEIPIIPEDPIREEEIPEEHEEEHHHDHDHDHHHHEEEEEENHTEEEPVIPVFENDPFPEIELNFGTHADASIISEYTIKVLKELLNKAGESSAKITSTARTPERQAKVMKANIERFGVAHQKRLYSNPGDQVIDAYVQAKNAGKSSGEIVSAMKEKILELGPMRVSRHCADPAVLQVLDIAPSSIRNDQKFVDAIEADRRVSKLLKPPRDPAFHLEIPQSVV